MTGRSIRDGCIELRLNLSVGGAPEKTGKVILVRAGPRALVHHQFEVYRLSGLDLHALRLITRSDQSVRSLWYVELDKAQAISSSRSDDAPIGRIQNRHFVPT